MEQIRNIAPTILDAVKAVERGCLKIQNDLQFIPRMCSWLSIGGDICYGCLATSTMMELTNKTGNDIIQMLTKGNNSANVTFNQSRAFVFGMVQQINGQCKEFSLFEAAIDSLRHSDLWPLLKFYNLQDHTNAPDAIKWLLYNRPEDIHFDTTKAELQYYATFLRDHFIPKLENWFPA